MHKSNNACHDYKPIDIDTCISTCTLYMHTHSYRYAHFPLVNAGLG